MVVRGDARDQPGPPGGPPLRARSGTAKGRLSPPRRGLRHRREPPATSAASGRAVGIDLSPDALALLPGARGRRRPRGPPRPALPGRVVRRRDLLRRDLPRLGHGRPRRRPGDGAGAPPRRPPVRARPRAAGCSGAATTWRCSPGTATREASSAPSCGTRASRSCAPPTATPSSSRSCSCGAGSTASPDAPAPTWASCPRRSNGRSAALLAARGRARGPRGVLPPWGRASSPSPASRPERRRAGTIAG